MKSPVRRDGGGRTRDCLETAALSTASQRLAMTRSYLSPGLGEKGEKASQVMLLLCWFVVVRRPHSDGHAPFFFPEPVATNQSPHVVLSMRTMHMATLHCLTILGNLLHTGPPLPIRRLCRAGRAPEHHKRRFIIITHDYYYYYRIGGGACFLSAAFPNRTHGLGGVYDQLGPPKVQQWG